MAFLILLATLFFGIHFLPAIIAGTRHTRNFWWIFTINLFLAWTVVGWVVALVWALRDQPRYYVVPSMYPPYNL